MNFPKIQNVNILMKEEDFHFLSKTLGKFNIFHATDMGRREIKHTKFLKYLLDPNESHGLGSNFLRNFLLKVSASCEKLPPITDLDLSLCMVTAEEILNRSKNKNRDRLDLYLETPVRGQGGGNLIIAIENKLDATQSSGQLTKYHQGLMERHGDQCIHLFLSDQGEKPDDDNWFLITYTNHVVPALRMTRNQMKGKISEYIDSILNDYENIFLSDEDENEAVDSAARRLIEGPSFTKDAIESERQRRTPAYVTYAKTFDFLINYDNDDRSRVVEHFKNCANFKSAEGRQFHFETSCRRYVRFSYMNPKHRENLIRLSESTATKWLKSGCPIAFEVVLETVSSVPNASEYACSWKLIVGPCPSELRIALLDTLARDFQFTPDRVKWTSINLNTGPARRKKSKENKVLPWVYSNVVSKAGDPSVEIEAHAQKLAEALEGFDFEAFTDLSNDTPPEE
jgi:hypothetical protein